MSLEGKNILLGITGSVAAYKAVELARLLVSGGSQVRAVLSESAQKFIGVPTIEAVTGRPAVTSFWDASATIEHIEVADWADLIVVAPATADVIAKLAFGFADTPLLASVLASKAPLFIAPAMNVNMWEHQRTQENIQILKRRGVRFIEPGIGELACGWIGTGRLAEPTEIYRNVTEMWAPSSGGLTGKRVVITAGPTREAIDPVRFLSNRSSGKMGIALAREAAVLGADVTLIHGPISCALPRNVQSIPVTTAIEMKEAVFAEVFSPNEPADIFIMAAAVADFRPADESLEKIKKERAPDSIRLVQNPDILAEVGERKANAAFPFVVGFAVETGESSHLLAEARRKLRTKNAELMVGNLASDSFDLDTNRVWLVDRTGREEALATSEKSHVARSILQRVEELRHG